MTTTVPPRDWPWDHSQQLPLLVWHSLVRIAADDKDRLEPIQIDFPHWAILSLGHSSQLHIYLELSIIAIMFPLSTMPAFEVRNADFSSLAYTDMLLAASWQLQRSRSLQPRRFAETRCWGGDRTWWLTAPSLHPCPGTPCQSKSVLSFTIFNL